MEDIQDGKKVSIQDGKTEDPKFATGGKSFIGAIYVAQEIGTPKISGIATTHVKETVNIDCNITTILGTAVT